MRDTCCEGKCAYLKSGMVDEVEQCPNYLETMWSKEGDAQPLLVRDCCPKRQLIMMQDVHNRVFAVQKSQTEQRNAASALAVAMKEVSKEQKKLESDNA